MAFGKTFETRKDATEYLKKRAAFDRGEKIRRLPKKYFPRNKKIYHVGTELEFLNFEN